MCLPCGFNLLQRFHSVGHRWIVHDGLKSTEHNRRIVHDLLVGALCAAVGGIVENSSVLILVLFCYESLLCKLLNLFLICSLPDCRNCRLVSLLGCCGAGFRYYLLPFREEETVATSEAKALAASVTADF